MACIFLRFSVVRFCQVIRPRSSLHEWEILLHAQLKLLKKLVLVCFHLMFFLLFRFSRPFPLDLSRMRGKSKNVWNFFFLFETSWLCCSSRPSAFLESSSSFLSITIIFSICCCCCCSSCWLSVLCDWRFSSCGWPSFSEHWNDDTGSESIAARASGGRRTGEIFTLFVALLSFPFNPVRCFSWIMFAFLSQPLWIDAFEGCFWCNISIASQRWSDR